MKKIISLFLALALILCTVTFTTYASEKDDIDKLEKELLELRYRADHFINDEGYIKPYNSLTFERLQNGVDYADEVLHSVLEPTAEQYQDAIDVLEYAFNNPTIDTYFAKETYVLSLKEHNENGFYYENDWNDFSAKRDALRDSFKTKDEEIVSDAFFALHRSFMDMTAKYTLSGDVNNDGKINIDDATLVQKYLACMETLTEMQKKLSCAYSGKIYDWDEEDWEPDIDCVTGIQKCAAGLVDLRTSPNVYGMMIDDGMYKYNTRITLIIIVWDKYDYVQAKVAELEAEGII